MQWILTHVGWGAVCRYGGTYRSGTFALDPVRSDGWNRAASRAE